MVKEILNTKTEVISNMLTRAQKIQADCQDWLVPTSALSMNDKEQLVFNGHELDMSDWALKQLGEKYAANGAYFLKCREAGAPELTAYNANYWLKRKAEQEKSAKQPNRPNTMIRGYTNRVRAIVSDKYAACDSPVILETVADFLPEDEWEILGSYMNEERLHLRFVSHDKMKVANDSVFPAVFVDSSDVGRCSVNVQFGFYRLACTNGLVIPAFHMRYRQKHVGISVASLVASLETSLKHFPAMVENAEDMIRAAAAKKINLVDETEVEAIIKELRNRGNLRKSDAEAVIDFTRKMYPSTRWGLVNGMTQFAQTKSLDDRLFIETAAGKLLAA